jgi:hypothetical protein
VPAVRKKLWLALVALASLLGSVVAVGTTQAAAAGAPPQITIYNPSGGYPEGMVVPAAYYCSDPDGDATVVSCVGDLPWGTTVPAVPGLHTFTVTATDDQGNVTTKTVPYSFQAMTKSCSAAVVRLNDQIQGHANPAQAPCTHQRTATFNEVVRRTELVPGLGLAGPVLTIQGGTAAAGPYAGQTYARADRVLLELWPDEFELIGLATTAQADISPTVVCGASHTSSSSIGLVRRTTYSFISITTELPALTVPLSIPLGIGTLHLNQRIVEGNTIIRRALFLDRPGTKDDIIVAESRAGVTC